MRLLKFLPLIGLLTLGACSSSGVAWKNFESNSGEKYCEANFKKFSEVDSCNIDQAAYMRSKTECKKSSRQDYCMLMATYSWDSLKHFIEKPTLEHALTFPITCEWGENRKLCSSKD